MSELANNGTVTFKLTRPIEAHGESIKELHIKQPTGKIIRELGMPFTLEGKKVDFNADAILSYVGLLADIPPSAVNNIHPFDFIELAKIISYFFVPPLQTS